MDSADGSTVFADLISGQNDRNLEAQLFPIFSKPDDEAIDGVVSAKQSYFSHVPNNYGSNSLGERPRYGDNTGIQRQRHQAKPAVYELAPSEEQIGEIVPVGIWLQNDKEDEAAEFQDFNKRHSQIAPTFRLGKREGANKRAMSKLMVVGEKNPSDVRSPPSAVKLDLFGKQRRRPSPTHRLGKKDEEEESGLWLHGGKQRERVAYGDIAIPRIRLERRRDSQGLAPTFRLGKRSLADDAFNPTMRLGG